MIVNPKNETTRKGNDQMYGIENQMRSIEIDFDVHKRIEMERRSYAETPNTVLRRLLGLNQSKEQADGHVDEKHPSMNGSWNGKGVTLPTGTQVRMEYCGRRHFGVIEKASWVVDGKKYKSPSAAAGGSARSKKNTQTYLNGWKYWWVKRPSDERWLPLRSLRSNG